MHATRLLLLSFLILSPLVSGVGITSVTSESDYVFTPSNGYDIVRNWTIKIVVVNYDASVINNASLLSSFPSFTDYSTTEANVLYNIEYELHYADQQYVDDLRQVILDNSVNGSDTGSWLDEAALEYHETNVTDLQTIFYPRDGRVIDAYAVEDWMLENPVVESPDLGYMYYVLNLTEFDSADHAVEHWFDYHPVDIDTNETQDWFRLEWDNALNPDVKFQYPGFGGRKSNIYVLDPSADQWYLRWARIWWGDAPYGDHPEHCTMDLEDKLATVDLETTPGIDALTAYLAEYMSDPITHLMMPSQHNPTRYVQTGLLRALVFAMDVDEGVSVDSLRWVTNAERQKEHLEELFPFISWDVQVDFLDITEHPEWEALFWSNATIDGNTTIADGLNMFYDIFDQMKPLYVDVYDLNINVFGVVFIKKGLEMHYQDRTYTGLGGSGQTVIWKSWERYYRPDEVTPKAGISSVQLHETMHAIGIMHTWSYGHYVGDFSYSPMGYYGRFNGTSTFDRNWVQGTYLDQMETDIRNDFQSYVDANPTDWTTAINQAYDNVMEAFDTANDMFNVMNWMSCFEALEDARKWAEVFLNSFTDNITPNVGDWNFGSDYLNPLGFPFWAEVTDALTEVYNVTARVIVNGIPSTYPCTYNGSHWIAVISPLSPGDDVSIRAEAYDYGSNLGFTAFAQFDVPDSTTTISTTTSSITSTTTVTSTVTTTTPSTSTTSTTTSTETTTSNGWPFPFDVQTLIIIGGAAFGLIIIIIIIRRRG
ncbi:MAG: hypothetical protein RTU92_11010 [Candidatus Thorarchaeota archaeon]